MFQPSVACPECQYANDETFKFCQNCGYHRKETIVSAKTKLRFELNESAILDRKKVLNETHLSSRYGRQKSALELELSSFLSSLCCPKTVKSALPEDVVAFLIWKDQGGRTVVHNQFCPRIGEQRSSQCACPKRLAHGTVDSLIGKLRTIFAENGRGSDWHSLLGMGNPATDRSVKTYLANIRQEQLKVHVIPKQAEPFLVSDLEILSRLKTYELFAIRTFRDFSVS